MPRLLLAAALFGLIAPVPLAASSGDLRKAPALSYIRGRLALADSNPGIANRHFGSALRAGLDNTPLLHRALEAAILDGDSRQAARYASEIRESRSASGFLAAVTRAATAAGRRDVPRFEAAVEWLENPRSPGHAIFMKAVLGAYALAAKGETDAALEALEPYAANRSIEPYILEHQAYIQSISKRWQDAAETYARLAEGAGQNIAHIRLATAATMLEAARELPDYRERAKEILAGGAPNDPLLVAAREKLDRNPGLSGKQLGGLPTRWSEGVGLFLLQTASDLGREDAIGPATTFARLATFAAPGVGATWIGAADYLGRSGQPDLALKALDRTPRERPWPRMAETQRILILSRAKRYDAARRAFRARIGKDGGRVSDYLLLADIERNAGDNARAADAISQALALQAGEKATPNIEERAYLHFMRGALLERSGNWNKAEPDLRKAVRLQDNNPLYLNYLGYSLLDRDLAPGEAQDYITRAYEAAPTNGAIIDSMGWARYQNGDYEDAVRLLQDAYAREAGDPNVASHLGDALWMTGRRFEARHAWNAALALAEEDSDLQKALLEKRDFGLSARR